MTDREEVLKTARLSALEFTGEELERIVSDMKEITAFAETVKGADVPLTKSERASYFPVEELREDVPSPSFSKDDILSNAEHENGMFKAQGGI